MAYADTDHLFSQPIRYYKANDPYYYEVDNIPIRQLEENILWAKDQIDSLLSPASGAEPQVGSPLFVGDDIDLEHIKQLRPKFVGGRTIAVNAGRFMARVNDAYKVNDSLAQLVATYIGNCPRLPKITQNDTTAFFDAVYESYTTKLTTASFVSCPGESNEAAAYRANGLESMYTFYLANNYGNPSIPTATVTSYGAPEYRADGSGRGKTFPGLWHADIENLGDISRTTFDQLNTLHVHIVQHWRGVIRTSVVDFRGQSIDISPFDQFDYYYESTGETGEEQVVSLDNLAEQRIDLLVVYTHPIDASGTTLPEYTGVSRTPVPGGTAPATPKSMVTPRLGIIRGAGVGIKRAADDRIELVDKLMYPGEQKILANLNDHTDGGSNTGIKLKNGSIIHGSFPSPDDLANIAPNLSLSLADDDLQLIGQTALPIAYVVVTKDSTNLTQEDIIDIRPFMRTAELSYNERAGIAGAQPALSFANPAVGAAQLDDVADCLQAQIDSISTTNAATTAASVAITKVHSDYIMGGLAYGPEGTLLGMNAAAGGPWDQTLNGKTPGSFGGMEGLGTTGQKDYMKGLYEGQEALGGSLTLSKWLADLETANGERGNYLGVSNGRVIPLLPEWQAMISSETTQPDKDAWYSGGVTKQSFLWKHNMDENFSNGRTYIPIADGTQNVVTTPMQIGTTGTGTTQIVNKDLNGNWSDTQNGFYYLNKPVRVILPPNAINFSVICNYMNCVDTVGTSPTVARTGIFSDSNGNSVVDLAIMIKYPVQNEGNFPYRVFGFGSQQVNQDSIGSIEPLAAGLNATSTRGNETTPWYKTGYCYYPTVSLTLAFHEGTAKDQMVPSETLNIDAAGTTNWTSTNTPPIYQPKVIDLTQG